MEKTLKKQSLNYLSNTPNLFDLKELLSSLKITPGQIDNMCYLPFEEGLTERQIRFRGRKCKFKETGRFGVGSCLYYWLFKDNKGAYLFLFNGDRECFRALFFNSTLLN